MPCFCEIDLERRLVVERAWDVLTYDEIVKAYRQFTSDPRFHPDFSQLFDGSQITRLELTASQVGELAMICIFSSRSRRAFVMPTGQTHAAARMFQSFRQINGSEEQIKLFRTLAEAEAWLAG